MLAQEQYCVAHLEVTYFGDGKKLFIIREDFSIKELRFSFPRFINAWPINESLALVNNDDQLHLISITTNKYLGSLNFARNSVTAISEGQFSTKTGEMWLKSYQMEVYKIDCNSLKEENN